MPVGFPVMWFIGCATELTKVWERKEHLSNWAQTETTYIFLVVTFVFTFSKIQRYVKPVFEAQETWANAEEKYNYDNCILEKNTLFLWI